MRHRLFLAAMLGVSLATATLRGADSAQDVQRYRDMLRKRPQPGAIFDRFMVAWLETGSLDSLRADLSTRAKAPGAAAADHFILALFQARQGQDMEAVASYTAALALEPDNAL